MAIVAGATEKLRPEEVAGLRALIRAYPYKKYQYIRSVSEGAIEEYYVAELREAAGSEESAVFGVRGEGGWAGLAGTRYLPWDSGLLGAPCGRIFALLTPADYEGGYKAAEGLLRAAREWAVDRGIRMVDVRCDAREVAVSHALQAAGYRMMEASITFAYSLAMKARWEERDVPGAAEVRLATEADLPFVRRAAKMFRNDRFHKDPQIGPAAADRLYEEWLMNSALQKRGYLYLALVNDRPVGLQTMVADQAFNEHTDKKVGSWELTAILPHAGSRDIWRRLSFHVSQEGIRHGLRIGEGRTQIYNLNMMNVMREPPEFSKGELTFHGWLE